MRPKTGILRRCALHLVRPVRPDGRAAGSPRDRHSDAGVVALLLLLAACGSGSDGAAGQSTTPPVASTAVSQAATKSADVEPTAAEPRTSTPAPVPSSEPATVASSEPATPAIEPTATITVGDHVDGGMVTEDGVWAVVTEEDMLYLIDPDTNSVVKEVPVPGIGFLFDIGHGAAWVPDSEDSVVRRVDLDGGKVVAEIPTGLSPEGISVTDSAVWVANHHDGTVTRIDPSTNKVVATISVGPKGPGGPQPIMATTERVWVGVPSLGQVVIIDATTNAVVSNIDSSATCGEMSIIDGSVWVTNCFESDDVAVIDETGGQATGSEGRRTGRHGPSHRWRRMVGHHFVGRT